MESKDAAQLIGVGEFAQLGGVSIKALRLYGALGLLDPAAVKPQTGYRMYARSQLSRLHRILLLKNAGFALAEIGGQIANRDDAALMRIRARLVTRSREIQRQIEWLDAEIHAAPQAVVKRIPRLGIWSRRQRIDTYGHADELLRGLWRPGRLVSGAIWHDCGQRTGRIDCEVFWVAPRALRGGAPNELAPATVASILHDGDDAAIGSSYEAIQRWMKDNGFQIAGPKREIYLGPSLTEIQFPIGK